MTTRLEYLRQEYNRIRSELDSYVGIDPWKYIEVSREYNQIAREYTWLKDLDSLLPMPHQWASYTIEFMTLKTAIHFLPYRILSPFNLMHVQIPESPAAPRDDILEASATLLTFEYSLHFDELPPVRAMAESLRLAYIYHNDALKQMVNAIRYANAILQGLELTLKWNEHRSIDADWLIYEAPSSSDVYYPVITEAVWNAAQIHSAMEYHANKAKEEGLFQTVARLVYYYRQRNLWKIDWQPF